MIGAESRPDERWFFLFLQSVSHFQSRSFEKAAGQGPVGQHGHDFLAEVLVLTCFQKGSALAFGQFERGEVKLRNAMPTVPVHGLSSADLFISRASQTLARFQSVITVLAETLSASAVSSTLSPPKKRNSTTLLFRSSMVASASRASSRATRSGSYPIGDDLYCVGENLALRFEAKL